MKRVLMVAFHFPPYAGSSSIHRTVNFARHLPEYGWSPLVLTAHPRAYPQSEVRHQRSPEHAFVKRAFAFDAARHLAFRGAYLRCTALPDRWISWWFAGVIQGLRIVSRQQPGALWSTFPIATAHLIGLTLQRITGLPWVADFRDVMLDDTYPADSRVRRCYRWIEQRTMMNASRIVFTTQSMHEMCVERYPSLSATRCAVIPNGYDESDFASLVRARSSAPAAAARPIRLLHTGAIYVDDRDPRPFFQTLARLKTSQILGPADLRVDLRATGFDQHYRRLIHQFGLDDVVSLLPPLPHRDALQDCMQADALLLLQGQTCDRSIPAKAYEYLRLRKPILALTSEQGDTARLLRTTGGATVAPLESSSAIEAVLPQFVRDVRAGRHPLPDKLQVQHYDRRMQTGDLARQLDELMDATPASQAASVRVSSSPRQPDW